MKAITLSIFLFISFHCFAQESRTDSLKKAILEQAHQAPEYKEAFVNVNQVKIDIALANKGKLAKAAVVQEYNATLGKGMGAKQTFKDVELRINTFGDKFIQYTLLRAASKLALEAAAEKSN